LTEQSGDPRPPDIEPSIHCGGAGTALPRQRLDAALIHKRHKLLDHKQQVTFQQPNRDSRPNCREDTKPGGVGDRLLLALLLLV
jgi:hypothetical protein